MTAGTKWNTKKNGRLFAKNSASMRTTKLRSANLTEILVPA